MAFNAQNISNSTATKIDEANTSTVEGIRVSNTKSSGAVVIDLYILSDSSGGDLSIITN